MIYSMTGFGQGLSATDLGVFVVDVKTLNNRYLEIQIKLSHLFSAIEPEIRQHIAKHFSRGSIFVNVYAKDKKTDSGIWYNNEAIDKYIKSLKEIKKKFGLSGEIDINTIINSSGLINKEIIILPLLFNSIFPPIIAAIPLVFSYLFYNYLNKS